MTVSKEMRDAFPREVERTNEELADALDETVVFDNHMNEYQRGIIREAARRLREMDKGIEGYVDDTTDMEAPVTQFIASPHAGDAIRKDWKPATLILHEPQEQSDE